MKASTTVSGTHPVTSKENRMKPRTALLGFIAGAMIGAAGLIISDGDLTNNNSSGRVVRA